MPYEFYKILHILSILMVFVGLASWLYSGKRAFSIMHGIGLLVLLVSGFGLAARLGLVTGFPTWIWVKLGVWLCLGAVAALIKRKALPANVQMVLWFVLGGIAVFMAIYKPQF